MFNIIKWLVASDITKQFTSRRSLVKQEGNGSASAFCTQHTPVTGMLHRRTVQGPSGRRRRPDSAPSHSSPSRLPPCGGLAGADTAGPWQQHIALPPRMVLGAPSWRPGWLALAPRVWLGGSRRPHTLRHHPIGKRKEANGIGIRRNEQSWQPPTTGHGRLPHVHMGLMGRTLQKEMKSGPTPGRFKGQNYRRRKHWLCIIWCRTGQSGAPADM